MLVIFWFSRRIQYIIILHNEIKRVIPTNLPDIQEYNEQFIQLLNTNIVMKLTGLN